MQNLPNRPLYLQRYEHYNTKCYCAVASICQMRPADLEHGLTAGKLCRV